jgi:hypothetical protein
VEEEELEEATTVTTVVTKLPLTEVTTGVDMTGGGVSVADV